MYALVRERERVRVCVYFNDFLLLLDLQLAQFSLQAQGMYVWVRACVGIWARACARAFVRACACACDPGHTGSNYGVATVSRIDKTIGLFYRI